MTNVRGTAAIIHIGDVGPVQPPIHGAPSPQPEPEPEPEPSCSETFTREVAAGWGDSEFEGNPPWMKEGGGTLGLLVTDGTAILALGANPTVEVSLPDLSVPTEVLIRWRFAGVSPGFVADFGVELYDPGDANTYAVGQYQRNYSGSSDRIVVANDNGSAEAAVADAANGIWWFARLRATALETSFAMWPEGGTEPAALVATGAAWTSTPKRLSCFGSSVTSGERVEIDYIQIVEGC